MATAAEIREACISRGASADQANEAATAVREAIEDLITHALELRAVESSFEMTRPVRTAACDIRIETAFGRRGLLSRLFRFFRRT